MMTNFSCILIVLQLTLINFIPHYYGFKMPVNAVFAKNHSLKKNFSAQQPKLTVLDNVYLKDLSGKKFNFSTLHKKLVAVVFLSTECPLSQNYTLVLNKLHEKFKDNLDVVGVFPEKLNAMSIYRDFQSKYNVHFKLLLDNSQKLVELLGARITPEVFLLETHKKIIYRGAIDNWAVALGKHRTVITENYLQDNIEGFLKTGTVKNKETQAVGCYINKR